MHDEVDAIVVTTDQTKRVDIPAGFGAIALVRRGGRRYRIGACSEVPVVHNRVTVRSDRYYVWRLGFVHQLGRSFPCSEDRGRRDARATILPVASKGIGRARRHAQVCNVQNWIHGPGRRVGTPLGLCRADIWVRCTSRVREQGRNRVIRGGGPACGLHCDLTHTQRHRVFVIVEELNCPQRAAAAIYGGNGRSFHYRAFVKRDAGTRSDTWTWVRRRRANEWVRNNARGRENTGRRRGRSCCGGCSRG